MNDSTADTPETAPLIDDERLDALFEFLDGERVSEEALDLFAAHGLITALAIAPLEHDADRRHALVLESEPEWQDDAERQSVLGALDDMHRGARELLENGLIPDLPFDLEFDADDIGEEMHPIRLWCAGFMAGVFNDEQAWFGEQEAAAAELLLPFMTLSGLFDDEDPELAAAGHEPRSASALAGQLPELTLDLFLLYRAPPEKPAAASGSDKSNRKAGSPGHGGKKRGGRRRQ
ncbi:YecA/YgfB family protein [Kushneria aurantia]|uniref:YecA family protein n=1 Tax=Kushneria aurantia TaxID=504092 RepID=A0ABV6G2A5_9GAMM|nr:YecA family protein [Kushneria aurantia]